jgi:hypothetical protein
MKTISINHKGKDYTAEVPKSKLVKSQTKELEKAIRMDGRPAKIKVNIRYDDQCGNNHNTFSITGEVWQPVGNYGKWEATMGGCIHEEIVKNFPELEYLIKWHGVHSESPLYYLANTIYLAGERDYNGLLKGEVRSYRHVLAFNDGWPMKIKKEFRNWLEGVEKTGSKAMTYMEVAHDKNPKLYGSKFTPVDKEWGAYFDKHHPNTWYGCQFDDKEEAETFCRLWNTGTHTFSEVPDSWGEGKESQLDAARRTAVWPDATLEQLTDPDALMARLPALMQAFKADIEGLGFTY